MSQIIASTYEILQEIGSGGGGVVFLGQHLRLGKQVVLKADKRTLSAKPEVLRREVDALKNLSHTYIPQVYDFVVQDDTVYTVMDYIEGESLDKPLKRGQYFPQATVVAWACQLLEALCYLHNRPPHGILHSDIKPANIMLTPQGDIRLIDFNIALALGEEGAVRVGFSRGYASPEHYGIDYRAGSATQFGTDVETKFSMDNGETQLPQMNCDSAQRSSEQGKAQILLDVRSDIYSLGATLYHLLTGKRPAQDASDVMPISDPKISQAVIDIIRRAMAPNPDERYQSAAEMLYDLEHLHETDPRVRKLKRRAKATAAVLTAAFIVGGLSTFVGLRQIGQAEEAARIAAEEARIAEEEARLAAEAAERAERTAKAALTAVVNSENTCRDGNRPAAIQYALQALEEETPYTSRAQKALTEALGIYDLSDGFQSHLVLELPSEPIKVQLSPDGTRAAVMVSGELLVYHCESGEKIISLKTDLSARSDIVFVDEDVLLYAGDGALCAYDLAQQKQLWSGRAATGIALSGDRSTVAAIYKEDTLVTVYDVASGAVRTEVTLPMAQSVMTNDIFADPEDELFKLNENGSLLAVSFLDGGLRVLNLQDSQGDITIFETSEFTHFEGGFWDRYFVFSATGDNQSAFVAIDTEEMVQTGGFSSTMPFHVMTNETGVYISTENILVKIDPSTGDQTEVAYTEREITLFDKTPQYTVTAIADQGISVFDAYAKCVQTYDLANRCDDASVSGDYIALTSLNEPMLRLLKVKANSDAHIFTYDGDYPHYEARVDELSGTIMLFRNDGFRIYNMTGEILADEELSDAAQIYDQQFRRTEKECWLEIIYYDGRIQKYSSKNGDLIEETISTPPDESLYEEFFTDEWRITSPLHGQPLVYDKETGEQIGALETDAYLTYVTQVDDYVITEYISNEGKRYGVLLNNHCEALAVLPNLCDILTDGRLIFDDMSGNLRESRIYSLQEVKALAKK